MDNDSETTVEGVKKTPLMQTLINGTNIAMVCVLAAFFLSLLVDAVL